MERISKEKSPLELVVSSIDSQLDFDKLARYFQSSVSENVFKIGAICSGARVDLKGVNLHKKDIEFEMLARGYKRVKKEEVDDLICNYSITKEHLEHLKEAENMFFVPTFRKEDKDNLIMVNQVKKKDGKDLVILVSASKNDTAKRIQNLPYLSNIRRSANLQKAN